MSCFSFLTLLLLFKLTLSETTVTAGSKCIPNPICVETNTFLQDNVSSRPFIFDPSSYLSELSIPNGQSINTIYPREIEFSFTGTHNRTKDLQFAVRSYDTLNQQGSNGGNFQYATLDGMDGTEMDFDFILTADS